MKSTIFWDITLCSPLEGNRRSGGTYPRHLQVEIATCFQAGFLLSLFFDPEDGGNVPLKRQLTFNGLHSVISQKIAVFVNISLCDT
jgi:hypothetical protein